MPAFCGLMAAADAGSARVAGDAEAAEAASPLNAAGAIAMAATVTADARVIKVCGRAERITLLRSGATHTSRPVWSIVPG